MRLLLLKIADRHRLPLASDVTTDFELRDVAIAGRQPKDAHGTAEGSNDKSTAVRDGGEVPESLLISQPASISSAHVPLREVLAAELHLRVSLS